MILYAEPGLTGLELWRGVSRGATLAQLRDSKPEYFAGLVEFLQQLYRGEACSPDPAETQAFQKAKGFHRVIFCGGEAVHPLLNQSLRARPLPFAFEIDSLGLYAGRRGALNIFSAMSWRGAVALDLGQTQLKVITADANCSLPRDCSLLPFGANAIDPALGRARIRAFLRDGLTTARTLPGGPPDGVVLALPVALDNRGVAQPATYPGLSGAIEPLFADLFCTPWVLVNDAVLAAIGFPPRSAETTLVVTLGFGIGGALWTPPNLELA